MKRTARKPRRQRRLFSSHYGRTAFLRCNRICEWFLIALSPFWFSGSLQADYSTTINPQTTWGVWEGWGTSLCWWANVFGNRDDLADIAFTTNYTVLNGENFPGLGLNIARYNVGACTTNSINGEAIQLSTNMAAFRQMPGYWLDWFSSDPSSTSWNWTVDANQRAMVLKAKARGANFLELFSNSPIWWMCYNHNPSGATNGSSDNLQSWNYDQHAIYLATVAKYAHDFWGFDFTSVEAFNEPIANWWTATGKQEGCHFNTGTQAAVLGYLRSELNNRGLNSTPIAASDESYYDQATSTWNSFSSTTKSQVAKVNVHGYQYGGGRRDLLYSAVAGKRLWNSEYGESDGTGVSLAKNLNLDFRWLHPTAWCYWQVLDSGGWGLIQSNPDVNWIGNSNPKYYFLAQYTRHIRPGMTIIDGGEGNTIAAYDGAAHKLILVTMNYNTPQWINYSLSNFPYASGPVRRWMSGQGVRYAAYSDTLVTNKTFSAWFPTNTIQTFEVQNVDLHPVPSLTVSAVSNASQLVISWPTWASNANPYSTTSLLPPVQWQLLTNTPQTSNNNFYVIIPTTNYPQQFFRLAP